MGIFITYFQPQSKKSVPPPVYSGIPSQWVYAKEGTFLSFPWFLALTVVSPKLTINYFNFLSLRFRLWFIVVSCCGFPGIFVRTVRTFCVELRIVSPYTTIRLHSWTGSKKKIPFCIIFWAFTFLMSYQIQMLNCRVYHICRTVTNMNLIKIMSEYVSKF